MTTTPAGWYPDPYGSPLLRWWDGTQWTDATHAPGQETGPAQPQQATQPHQATQPQHVPQPQQTAPQWTQPPGGPAGGPGPWGPGPWGPAPGQTAQLPMPQFGTPQRTTPVWPWVVGGIAAVVVLALVVGGAIVILRERAGSIVARPQNVPTAAPSLDSIVPVPTRPGEPSPERSTRPLPQLPQPTGGRINDPVTGLSYAHPGDKWQVPKSEEINDPSDEKMPLWTSGYQAMSQQNYDGRDSDWVGNVYSAEVPQVFPYSGPQSFQQLSQALLLTYDQVFYGIPHERKVLRSEAMKVSGRQAWITEFEMDFSKVAKDNNLKWRKERGAIVLVERGENLRPAMLYISVPDNLDQSVIKRVLNSLQAQ